MKTGLRATGFLLAGVWVAVLVAITGCEIDSAESGARSVSISVQGFYQHPNAGSFVVQNTSGASVSSLDVIQTGDRLQAVDNNGIVFGGSIGQVTGSNTATFVIEGRSTAGQTATISGNIAIDGTTATMRGTWIEPTLTSPLFAQATVPTNAVQSADPTDALSLNQTLVTVTAPGGTTSFSASGGSGGYSWALSNQGIGQITSITGADNSTAAYTASRAGNNTITVSDSSGSRVSATIQQTAADTGGGTSGVTLNQTLVTIDSITGTASFTASGGSGTFTWTVNSTALGNITSLSGDRNQNMVYTAGGVEGQNVISVTDSETRDSATATINQVFGLDLGNIFTNLPPIP